MTSDRNEAEIAKERKEYKKLPKFMGENEDYSDRDDSEDYLNDEDDYDMDDDNSLSGESEDHDYSD